MNDYLVKPKEREMLLKNVEKLYEKISKQRKWSDILTSVVRNANYTDSVLKNRMNFN
jgi:YesN/AraC family two-component response regulator